MKKTIYIPAIALLLGGCSSSNSAPDKVKNSFAEKFPKAESIGWDKENDSEWEAEFKMNGKEYSANFNADGSWIETEYEIEFSDVPEAVKATLNFKYSNYKKEEIEFSEKTEGIFYEFELESDEQTIEVAFNESGEIVKEEIVESEEDED